MWPSNKSYRARSTSPWWRCLFTNTLQIKFAIFFFGFYLERLSHKKLAKAYSVQPNERRHDSERNRSHLNSGLLFVVALNLNKNTHAVAFKNKLRQL